MTIKINRGTGAGGSKTNTNGIRFEEDVYLKEWLEKKFELHPIANPGCRSEFYAIKNNNDLLGYYGRQGSIYKALKLVDKSINDSYVNSILSKKINPDGFIIRLKPLTLVIFEKKWQQTSGSVDEKIQTAPFKLTMFNNLLSSKGFHCQYQYILSRWFKNKQYKNVKDYYKDNPNIKVWVCDENLSDLRIEDYVN